METVDGRPDVRARGRDAVDALRRVKRNFARRRDTANVRLAIEDSERVRRALSDNQLSALNEKKSENRNCSNAAEHFSQQGEVLMRTRRAAELISGQLLKERVKVRQVSVFDNNFAAPFAVFNVHFQSECALQALFHLANIWIDNFFRLGFLLLFGIQKALHIGFRLANRKRKTDYS